MTKKLTCIMCPRGCEITIKNNINDEIIVSGNNCPRGNIYAKQEINAPTRIITSLVKTAKGIIAVKTTNPIPKNKINDCLNLIASIKIKSAKQGDILIKNVLGLSSDIIVTREPYKL